MRRLSGDEEVAEQVPPDPPEKAAPYAPAAAVPQMSPTNQSPEATAAPTPSPVPLEKPSAEEEPPTAELGEEQIEARNRSKNEAPATLRATVVDFDFVGYQRLLVQLDNGQVWRQIDGDRTSVERGLRDETSFDVEMWGTALGGYRMRILPLERTIRVERLK